MVTSPLSLWNLKESATASGWKRARLCILLATLCLGNGMASPSLHPGCFAPAVPQTIEAPMQVAGNPWLDPTHYISAGYWGAQGSGPGQFESVWQLAIDSLGNVLTTDSALDCIQKFSSTGSHLATYGRFGNATDEFELLVDVACGLDSQILALDGDAAKVKVFDSNGSFLRAWSTPFPHSLPVAIWVDGNKVYVVDGGNQVAVLSLLGELEALWGEQGSQPGELLNVGAVATVSDGTVVVADWGNERLQRFTNNGTFLSTIDLSPLSTTTYWLDNDLWVDRDDYIYVTDRTNNQILKLNLAGDLVTRWGQAGNGTGDLLDPIGLAVDAGGTVYVAEHDNFRVQLFVPVIGGPLVRFVGGVLVMSLCAVIIVGVWVWLRHQHRAKASAPAMQKRRG
jgi:DNA-binding beta-propeller fold protein YncE